MSRASTPDTELKARHRKMWASGDYPSMVETFLLPLGPRLVEAAGIGPGMRVLDVAAGTGNASLPAAKRGARVTASDLTPELLEAGKARAADEGLELEWAVADAENLPFEDGSFDVVISVFGIMFAPDHRRAAGEAARVLRPGGRIVLCNWTPGGEVGKFFAMMAGHMPPPPEGFQPPPLWGTGDHVRELFAGTGIEPSFERAHVHWDFDSPEDGARLFIEKFGPVVTAKAALEPEGKWEAAERDIHGYFEEKAADDGTVGYDGEYLVSTGTKAG
ncbi:MAG: class I SAM-dependent methyltransferase [Solirubrobacterales bacterium]